MVLDDVCFIIWEIEEVKILFIFLIVILEYIFFVMFFRVLGKEWKEKFYFLIVLCNGRFLVSVF